MNFHDIWAPPFRGQTPLFPPGRRLEARPRGEAVGKRRSCAAAPAGDVGWKASALHLSPFKSPCFSGKIGEHHSGFVGPFCPEVRIPTHTKSSWIFTWLVEVHLNQGGGIGGIPWQWWTKRDFFNEIFLRSRGSGNGGDSPKDAGSELHLQLVETRLLQCLHLFRVVPGPFYAVRHLFLRNWSKQTSW